MSIFGAGLLVGTALTVIIPEGIRALYTEMTETTPVICTTEGQQPVHGGTEHQHSSNEHSFAIGMSLVLGKGWWGQQN